MPRIRGCFHPSLVPLSKDTQIPVLRGHPLPQVYTFPFERVGVIREPEMFDRSDHLSFRDVNDVAVV